MATEGISFIEIVKRIEEAPDGKYFFVIEDSTEFKDGESVIIPAGKIHWHGAKKGSKDKFSHIAILRNTPTFWLQNRRESRLTDKAWRYHTSTDI